MSDKGTLQNGHFNTFLFTKHVYLSSLLNLMYHMLMYFRHKECSVCSNKENTKCYFTLEQSNTPYLKKIIIFTQ